MIHFPIHCHCPYNTLFYEAAALIHVLQFGHLTPLESNRAVIREKFWPRLAPVPIVLKLLTYSQKRF